MLQDVTRDDRLLGGPQAQVLPIVMHLDDLPQVSCGKCLPGTSTLTALETVSGPGYCLITSMPMDWSVAFCVEEGFLGAMRAMSLRFARRAVHTLFARTAGVNVSRVPQVPVWTRGGYLGIRCTEGIALTHTPR